MKENRAFIQYDKLICKRENLINSKFGNSDAYENMVLFPENKYWYAFNVMPLDNKIIDSANKIAKNILHLNKTFSTLKNVFENQELSNWYKDNQKSSGKEF